MEYRGAVSAGGYSGGMQSSSRIGPATSGQLYSQQSMSPDDREALENTITSRPFSFTALPGARSPGSFSLGRQQRTSNTATGQAGSTSSSSSGPVQPINANPSAPANIKAGVGRTPSIKVEASANDDGGTITPGAGTGGGKGGKQGGASDFVKKLYRMLEEDQFKNIVTWGAKNDSFVVKDMNEFTKTVLPQHFKHSNFASFVRQLNKYDFHKIKNPEANNDGTGENYWEFKHPSFSIDMKHSLENIKRKITTAKKPETPGAYVPSQPSNLNPSSSANAAAAGISSQQQQQHKDQIEYLSRQVNILTQNQQQIEGNMEKFTAQYQALMADLLGQHRAIAAQDAFTATTLQYIINLESRLLSMSNPSDPPNFPPSNEAHHLMITYSELSRMRYDKMTETTRRAEALGLFVNGSGLRRPSSPFDQPSNTTGTDDSSPEYSRNLHQHQQQQAPYGITLPPALSHPLSYQQQQQPQSAQHSYFPPTQSQHPHQQPQHAYFTTQSLKQQHSSTGSPSSSGPSDSPRDSRFASLGELRLGSRNLQSGNHDANSTLSSGLSGPSNASILLNKPTDAGMGGGGSYFPAPGSAPIRPSMAITPGAVMISKMNGNMLPFEDSREDSEDLDNGLTATNTSLNQQNSSSGIPLFSAENEDIAMFAAALKGGQSKDQVRSALTSQPLIVRRATYIPEWSVPPRVLLVEDDPVCRNLTTKFLQIFGCTIEVAADGVEAVNKMQTGVYDICMMDITMPNLDGVSATSLIRQFDAMTPIISMTGNSRPDEVLTYFSHGMNDVLPKPFTKEGMLSMLEKHLLHLKQIHQNPKTAPLLDNMDLENFDPSVNPFQSIGLTNEDYAALMSGSMFGVRTPSQSPGAAGATASLGQAFTSHTAKRSLDGDAPDGNTKRTRFQEMQ